MSERLPRTGSPFTARTAVILIVVALLSLGAVLTLMAWSPDLAPRDRAGPTPYSRSSVGYSGLITMLEARGHPVTVSRRRDTIQIGGSRLLVLTVPLYGPEVSIEDVSGPALIVLPKWSFEANPAKKSWELDTELARLKSVEAAAAVFDETIEVYRLRDPGSLDTSFGIVRPSFEHEMQVLRSGTLEPVVEAAGGTLLAKLPDEEIYILSDPDVLNNFGLARLENAKTGLGMIDFITRRDDQSIIFDATLHGFERSTNLMKILLSVPWIGATLLALASMALIIWSAAVRLGAPEREAPAIAAGKRADVALGFEGLIRDGGADMSSIARRSSESWTVTATGRAGHSSGIFGANAGDGAIYELARIIHRFRTELPEPNLTFNVGLVAGGEQVTLDDGKIRLRVTGCADDHAETEIITGGTLTRYRDFRPHCWQPRRNRLLWNC